MVSLLCVVGLTLCVDVDNLAIATTGFFGQLSCHAQCVTELRLASAKLCRANGRWAQEVSGKQDTAVIAETFAVEAASVSECLSPKASASIT